MRSCLTIVTMLVLGCGGGSGTDPSGSGGSGGSGGSQSGSPSAACISCLAQTCNSQSVAAFGPDYQSGDYTGGLCPKFVACTYAAGSTSGSADLCLQQESDDCKAAFATLNVCLEQSPCGTTCTGGSGGSQSGSPSAACISCLVQNCASESVVAFGPDYQSGDYTGGDCPHFISCAYARDSTPLSAGPCAEDDGPVCEAAFATLNVCLGQTACGTACFTGSTGG